MTFALPMALWVLFSRHRATSIMIVTALVTVLVNVFVDQLRALISPNEVSNNIKIMLFNDYSRILSDPHTLMFGIWLGAYEFWNAKSVYLYIFGLPGALSMLGLLLWPAYKEFSYRSNVAETALAIGWGGICLFVFVFPTPTFSLPWVLLLLIVLLTRQFLKQYYTFPPGVAR